MSDLLVSEPVDELGQESDEQEPTGGCHTVNQAHVVQPLPVGHVQVEPVSRVDHNLHVTAISVASRPTVAVIKTTVAPAKVVNQQRTVQKVDRLSKKFEGFSKRSKKQNSKKSSEGSEEVSGS